MVKKKTKTPDLEKTILKIVDLISQPGYLYSLLSIARNDLFLPIDGFEDVNWWDKISYQELGYLFGLLIRNPLDVSTYPKKGSLKKQIDTTYTLLKELHDYYSLTAFDSMIGEVLKEKAKSGSVSPTKTRIFNSPQAIIESTFYSDSGAYDFQYWDSAPKRYANDNKWFEKQFGFSIKDAVSVSQKLKSLCEYKANATKPKSNSLKDTLDWIFDLFTLDTSAIKSFSTEEKLALNKMSVDPGKCNTNFKHISDLNEFEIKPIIKLEKPSFLVPISFNLARCVDESPFYWIRERDKNYFKTKALDNRGKYTEKATFEILSKVFGKKNVYKNVMVARKKGQGIRKKGKYHTDIDVLAMFGNKAIVVQCKSKKLTLPAKQGDLNKLANDFKDAVQDAYEQGLIARKHLLSKDAEIVDHEGKPIKLSESLSEAYILTITTDSYPGLSFQAHTMLEKKDIDPYPIAINIYDLDVIAQYLADPFDFLFYVNQRVCLADKIVGDNEIACLGYHLDQKLYLDPRQKADRVNITSGFAQLIDDDLVRHLYGTEEDRKRGRLRQKWKNDSFNQLVGQIKSSGVPGLTDAVFFLHSLSSEAADELVEQMNVAKSKSLVDKQVHNFSMLLTTSGGISYFVVYDKNINLHKQIFSYAAARKYITKADEWLGISSYAESGNIIDSVVYSKSKWVYDPAMEAITNKVITKQGQVVKRKIGRNDPCYCGSGKKYKKCCYFKSTSNNSRKTSDFKSS